MGVEIEDMNVSRYIDTVELKFDVEFVTPCFLGGANGNAEIRVAPFKNLLRRWWRIANGNLSPEELWKKESRLFGSTEKDPDIVEENKRLPKEKRKPEIFGKSRVELKIIDSNFDFQKTNKLRFPNKMINHPEVKNPMSFETYLGMGPVFWNKEKKCSEYKLLPILEFSPARKEYDSYSRKEITVPERKSSLSFSLTVPAKSVECFVLILSYITYFGTIGSRSRNGWGSISIKNVMKNSGEPIELLKIKDIKEKSVDWLSFFDSCCKKQYPSSMASDEKGLLCWCTPQRNSWEDAMLDAAKVYSAVRTNFKLSGDNGLHDRHLLGYPITHHEYSGWPVKNTRLPSELYIKINLNQGKYRVQITHIPNLIPLEGFSANKQKEIWSKVHSFLDNYQLENDKGEKKNLSRFGGTAK